MRKKFSISCTELKSVQFWLIFVKIWLPVQYWLTFARIWLQWQLLWLLEVMDSIFEFADLENLTISEKNFSLSCAEVKSVQF